MRDYDDILINYYSLASKREIKFNDTFTMLQAGNYTVLARLRKETHCRAQLQYYLFKFKIVFDK